MNTSDLLTSVDSEIARLQEVLALLTSLDRHVRINRKSGKKRTFGAAQHKRWAARKKASKRS